MNKKILFLIITLFLLILVPSGISQSVYDDYNFRNIFSILNVVNLNVTSNSTSALFCSADGTCGTVTQFLAAAGTSKSAVNPELINTSTTIGLNRTWYNANVTAYIALLSGGNSSWNESHANTLYYPLSSNPSSYLNSSNQTYIFSIVDNGTFLYITDQRYNNTGLINSVGNWSADKPNYVNWTEGNITYLKVDGSNNMTGDLIVNDTITAYNNIIVGDESASASFRGLGDYYGIGSVKAMEGLYAEAMMYGAGLEILDNNVETISANIFTRNATLNASTKVIYDSEASFNDTYEGQFFRVISSTPSFTGSTGEIINVINSTHLVLSFATAGSNMIIDAVDMTYVIYPHPNLFVGDHGAISSLVGSNPDAKFEIHIPNGTGFHGVYVEDTAGADQHQSFTIDTDGKGYDGIVGINNFISSSEPAEHKRMTNLLLEADATGLNHSTGSAIEIKLIGQAGSGTVYDGILLDSNLNKIMKMGSSETLSIAYYDNGDGTTVEATGNFTSQNDDMTLFENDNSYIYIGNTANFTSIGISLSTAGVRNILAEYYYCNDSGNWLELLEVTDTTNGMRVSGTITFENPSDRGTCNKEVDGTAFANSTNFTYVAVKRTRNNYAGQKPVENLVSISGGSTWMFTDKYGTKPYGSAGAPYTCSQTYAGMTHYDTSAVALLWCDGSSWIEFAETADITVHNNLGGLQGGQATEYYHMTAAEYSDIVGKAYVDNNNASVSANLTSLWENASSQEVSISARAFPGTCTVGNVVQNTTASGVQCVADQDTTYSAGNGISLATTTFSVAGNTALSQDADGLSVTNDAIGDTQLTYNTGQHLTTTSEVVFDEVNATGTIINSSGMYFSNGFSIEYGS